VTIAAAVTVEARFEALPGGGNPMPGPTPAPSPAPVRPAPKPLRCKAGFRKAKVHGKLRCVKKPHRRHVKRGG
jgi:hypothetical protein